MEFVNQVVLITGASSGIGAATAEQFAKRSANLALVGRNPANLDQVVKTCQHYNVKILSIVADITHEKDVERIIRTTIDRYGRLDVLVNNAGISKAGGVLNDLVIFDTVMATNIRGAYQLTSLAAPYLIKTKGNIVNVSSTCSMDISVNCVSYCMSKAALDMFTKCVALELAPYGIRVNSVNPGITRTQIFSTWGMTECHIEKFLDRATQVLPLQRVSQPNEIADMIVYLSGHRSRGITGSIVFIDNGHVISRATYKMQMKD